MKTASISKRWDGRPIDSMERVLEALQHLDMPVPMQNALSLIASSSEKGKFRTAIEECLQLNGIEASQETKRYLFGLVECISEVMDQTLQKLGFQGVTTEAMFYIGKTNGMAFRSAVKGALDKTDPKHSVSLSLIETAFAEASDAIGVAQPSLHRLRSVPQNIAGGQGQSQQKSVESRPAISHNNLSSISNDESDKGYLSAHVYGGKAALCFNAVMSRDKKHHTIIVDAAIRKGERADWESAISIQLGHKELTSLYAVLSGWINSVKFDAHGVANEKSFELERQEGHYFIKVTSKDQAVRAIRMGSQDAYSVLMVVFAQIMKEVPQELRNHPALVIQMMKQVQNIAPVAHL